MVKILHNNLFPKSLLLVCSLLIFSAVQAQSPEQFPCSERTGRKMRLGFKLDPGASFLKPQDNGVERNSGRFYFSYGILADFFPGRKWQSTPSAPASRSATWAA